MTAARRFVLIVVVPVALLVPVVSWLALSLEPLDGDLTRIGGFREHMFGWNSEMERFDENLFEYGMYESDYTEYRDVVVIGDSYSHHVDAQDRQRGWAWQNFFVHRTGVSLVTFDHARVTVPELLALETFRRAPPRVLIWESTERSLFGRIAGVEGACRPEPVAHGSTLERKPPGVTTSPVRRIPDSSRPARAGLAAAAHYLKIRLLRLLYLETAVSLPYTGPALFSHRASDHLLVLSHEAGTMEIPSDRLDALRCGLLNLQAQVEASGVTLFVIMLVPDKSTMYEPFLDSPQLRFGSVAGRLPDPTPLHLLKLEEALRAAIEGGVVDLWLPNDSHWGSAGHQLAARVLDDYLVDQGVLPEH